MIETFLTQVFQGVTGFVLIWDSRKRSTWVAANDLSTAASSARALAAQNIDVYVGVGVHKVQKSLYERGKEKDVIAIPGFWADIDVGESKPTPSSFTDAAKALEEFYAPTLLVGSGGGLHAWWLFDKPWVFDTDQDWKAACLQSRLFQEKLRALWETKKWGLDHTSDLSRILRIPGTFNYKEDEPRPVTLLYNEGPRYRVSDLIASFGTTTSPPPLTGASSPPLVTSSLLSDSEIWKQLMGLQCSKEKKNWIEKAYIGEPISVKGNRDRALFRLISTIVFKFKDLPSERVIKLLEPTLLAMQAVCTDLKNPAPTRDKALDQIRRAKEDVKEKDEKEKEQDRKIREKLEQVAQENDCTPDDFERRWIIQIGKSYYIYVIDEKKYKGPFIKDALHRGLPQFLKDAPINWSHINPETGAEKKKLPHEIVMEYGSVALKIIAGLYLQRSYYDPSSDIFYDAVCPLRKLESVYNEQIDKWLRLLGGNEAEKLLDWVATVTETRFQSCAIFFSGASGTGKTLFAQSLAKLWHEGGPTKLSFAVSNFNADIARCPLIFADEHITPPWKGMNMSAELRTLIGSTIRTYSQKFKENADLKGSIRLIMAANNERLLSGDEDLGPDDIDAVGNRFLHVVSNPKSKDFLEKEVGAKIVHKWVENDDIAKHALWLRDNRPVDHSTRFLVQGSLTDMHRNLATEGFTNGLVCEWIAKFLMDPKPLLTSKFKDLVRIGQKEVLLNTNVVAEFWDFYIKKYGVPTTTRLGRILGNLSSGQKRENVNDKFIRYHIVNVDLIYAWADKNGIGDREDMEKNINRPLVAIQ